jgi:putative ABC transport system ATP-binding protein
MCLARTLIARPAVLLLDEPTSSEDAEAVRVIERAVRELADGGLSALWVSHDAQQVARVADRVLRIEHGRCLGITPVHADPGQVAQ